jgi:hypothetical protein
MSNTDRLAGDFDISDLTAVAAHLADFVPVELVPERIEVEINTRAVEWFADHVEGVTL